MKTRQEMIYDFMLTLSANPNMIPDPRKFQVDPQTAKEVFDHVYDAASKLADTYLGCL